MQEFIICWTSKINLPREIFIDLLAYTFAIKVILVNVLVNWVDGPRWSVGVFQPHIRELTQVHNCISNVTGWNYRPSQKHNLLGQNIYTEADRNHLQVHSRNRVETTHVNNSLDFLSVSILKERRWFKHLCKEVFNSIMNFLAVLHCVILISVCEILEDHRTNGKWTTLQYFAFHYSFSSLANLN